MVALAERKQEKTNNGSVLFVPQNEIATYQIESPMMRLKREPFMDYSSLVHYASLEIGEEERLMDVSPNRIISGPGMKDWATSQTDLNLVNDKIRVLKSGKVSIDDVKIPLFEIGNGAYIVANFGSVLVSYARLVSKDTVQGIVRKASPKHIFIKNSEDYYVLKDRMSGGLWSGSLDVLTDEEKMKRRLPPGGFYAEGEVERYKHIGAFSKDTIAVRDLFRAIGASGSPITNPTHQKFSRQ